MVELKYEKYIVTDVKPPTVPFQVPSRLEEQRRAGNYVESTHMFSLDDSVVKGAFYTNCVWLWDKKGTEAFQMEIAHTHDFDETLGFIGTIRDNPRELGGEIEFWLEDEQYIFTKSCLIYVPRGMKHLPLYFRRIDSPIFFWTAGNGSAYTRASGKEI